MQEKMKIVLSILFCLIFMGFYQEPTVCSAKVLKEKTKEFLDPFKYDSSELTRIMYKNKEVVKDVEIPLFIGEKYRIVFNTEALPKPIEINIYNKDKESKKRTLLFSSKDQEKGARQFFYECSKVRHVFVDYVVPKTDTAAMQGCVVCMIGYK